MIAFAMFIEVTSRYSVAMDNLQLLRVCTEVARATTAVLERALVQATAQQQQQQQKQEQQLPRIRPAPEREAPNQSPRREGLCTLTEAGKFLHVSRSKVYILMNSGQLPFLKLGRTRRITWEALYSLSEGSPASDR